MCHVQAKPSKPIDGVSLVEIMKTGTEQTIDWENRIVVSDSQRITHPKKWKGSAVMKDKWRLIMGRELYHVGQDPSQKTDIAKLHPEIVKELRAWYENWWSEIQPTFDRVSEIHLGGEHAEELTLTCLQWFNTRPIWNQGMIRGGYGISGKKQAVTEQPYLAVNVVESGKYQFHVRRWPRESGLKICEGTSSLAPLPGRLPSYSNVPGKALAIVDATMQLDGQNLETKPVTEQDYAISFIVDLPKGSHRLSPYFSLQGKNNSSKKTLGCYYIDVKQLKK